MAAVENNYGSYHTRAVSDSQMSQPASSHPGWKSKSLIDYKLHFFTLFLNAQVCEIFI